MPNICIKLYIYIYIYIYIYNFIYRYLCSYIKSITLRWYKTKYNYVPVSQIVCEDNAAHLTLLFEAKSAST